MTISEFYKEVPRACEIFWPQKLTIFNTNSVFFVTLTDNII